MKRLVLVAIVGPIIMCSMLARAQSPGVAGFESRLQSKTLSNGLTVIVVEKHGTARFSGTTTCLAGFSFDPPGASGTAHLTEHLLADFTIGSVGTPPELYRALGDAYSKGGDGQAATVKAIEKQIASTKDRGQWSVTTIADVVQYGVLDEPSEWLDRFVQAAASTLTDLRPKGVETQKMVVIQQLKEDYDVKGGVGRVSTTNLAAAFADRPYGKPGQGRIPEVQALKFESLQAFHKTYYSPDRCAVVAVGDVRAAELFQAVEKRVGDVPKQPPPSTPPASVPARQERRATVESTTGTRVVISFVKPALPARDDAVAQVLTALLTGGDHSRLARKLVTEQSIATKVDGSSGGAAALLYDNLMSVNVHPAGGHSLKELEAETLRQLETLKTEPVGAEELRDAIARVDVDPEQTYSNDFALAAAIARHQLGTGNWKNMQKSRELCRTVTVDDIAAFARKYFTSENRTVLTVVSPGDSGPQDSGAQQTRSKR